MEIREEYEQYIENRMKLYEKTYGIEVLMWSFRGSMDVGICRRNSDLDAIFIFKSKNKNIRAIHDIVGHGFDYWGWILEDAVEMIKEANVLGEEGTSYTLGKEHRRAGLDYYFGVYCAMGNSNAKIYPAFFKNCVTELEQLYSIKAAVACLTDRMEEYCNKMKKNLSLSGHDIMYAVWYAYMSKHLILNNKPGDNKFNRLVELYASQEEKTEIMPIHNEYRRSESKEAKKYYSTSLYAMFLSQYDLNKEFMIEKQIEEKDNKQDIAIENLMKFA